MQQSYTRWRSSVAFRALVAWAVFSATTPAVWANTPSVAPALGAAESRGKDAPDHKLLPLSPETSFALDKRSPEVIQLRQLLGHAGFGTGANDASDLFDIGLLKTVRTFQVSRKLKSTGIPRERTIGALNEILVLKPEITGSTPGDAVPPTGPAPSPSFAAVRKEDAGGGVSRDQPGRAAAVEASRGDLPMLDVGSVARLEQSLAKFTALKSKLESASASGGRRRAVANVHSRLTAEGFLPADAKATDKLDALARDALRKWQEAYGLKPSGEIDAPTRAAMRVSIEARIQQLEASLRRARALTDKLPNYYVLVNAAAAKVQVVEGRSVAASMPAIVGRGTRKTPEFVSSIPYIQLVPTWTAPRSIVRKDIAARARKHPAYLAEHQLRGMIGKRIVDLGKVNWRRGPYPTIVQKPGPHNALGLVRFGMARNGAYYIHGAAQPDLFKRAARDRFLSSGCVRVEDPILLAALVGKPSDASLSAAKIQEIVAQHDGGWKPGRRITLANPVTVVWSYFSAWVTADGITHFRDDIYRRDHAAPSLQARPTTDSATIVARE